MSEFAHRGQLNLFPTTVWSWTLRRSEFRKLEVQLDEVLTRQRPAASTSKLGWSGRRGGPWRSAENLQTDPLLAPLNRLVEKAAREILETLAVDSESFRIARCWLEAAPKWREASGKRLEPEHFLSGLYVVQAPEGGGLVFHDPRMQTNNVALRYKTATPFSAQSAILRVEPGMLVIFPAWLPRSLDSHHAEREFVLAGFDVMVKPRAA